MEGAGLMHLVDDPYTREEILTVIERHYPRSGMVRGVAALERDASPAILWSDRAPDEGYRLRRIERPHRLAPGARGGVGATTESRRTLRIDGEYAVIE